ncbi:ankyrin repeat and SAM domain-containing protein 6 isoform X1 [Gossypium hirsutum]|uniref:Ankyrin repeat and SAM domain-containing protein 6 isoform X1 n=1 Tax=Gossypium hirsutum TaxID=3635 RepID=A0A1U8LFW1_GOSHI|nr:ankyrin repeat and SAM domain-containing protein 6 isoform X1 [Gossypium hirsutum]
MYADRVEEDAGKRSVKERLNGNPSGNFIPRRQIAGKRQRQDDKWEHDLYQEDGPNVSRPNVSNRKVDARDLRLKLQRKSLQNVSQSGRGTLSGVRDLREKLSGTMNAQPISADPPKQKVKVAQPARKSVAVETTEPEPRRAANTPARKKAKQSADTSVEGFLQSLGLEKYAITFQAEEVDMTALVHMTDGDLKALGIPMHLKNLLLCISRDQEKR